MTQRLPAILAGLRNVFALERLPPAPPLEPRGTARRGLLRLLFAPEPLPLEPELPATRRRPVAALLAPEPLPEEPVIERSRRRGWLRLLFAPEPLDP